MNLNARFIYIRTIIVSFKQRSIVRILLFCYKIKLIDEIIQSKNIYWDDTICFNEP